MYGGDRSMSGSGDDNLSDTFSETNDHPSWASNNDNNNNSPRSRLTNSNKSIECSSVEIRITDTDLVSSQGKVGTNVHVVYIINVSPGLSKSWIVRRRFNDFLYLDKQLKKQNNQSNIKLPTLPRKRYFGSSSEPRFVEERRAYLEDYLQTLAAIPLVWVKSDFARFLDNENNSMIFIWNFERVRKMQESLSSLTVENKTETVKLSEELTNCKQQINNLHERLGRLEALFFNNNNSLSLNDSSITAIQSDASTTNSSIFSDDLRSKVSQSLTITTDDSIATLSTIDSYIKPISRSETTTEAERIFLEYSIEKQDSYMYNLTYYFDELINLLIPSQDVQETRRKTFDYIRQLLYNNLNVHILPVGSFVSNTYLPNGDIDITGLFTKTDDESWFAKTNETLCYAAFNALNNVNLNATDKYIINNVSFINADIKLIKSSINSISIDLSANQVGGLFIQLFIESIDKFIDQNHLFKRSLILIKAWCIEESDRYSNSNGSIHGTKDGRLSTSCINVMIVWIFNCFGSKLFHPIQVLYHFLKFYQSFDWNKYAITIYGPKSALDLSDVDFNDSIPGIQCDYYIPFEVLDYCKDRYSNSYDSVVTNYVNQFSNNSDSIDTPRSTHSNSHSTISVSNALSTTASVDEAQAIETINNSFIVQSAFADPNSFYKRGLMNVMNGVAPKNNLSRAVDINGFESIKSILKNGFIALEGLLDKCYKIHLTTLSNKQDVIPIVHYVDKSTRSLNRYVESIVSFMNNSWKSLIEPILLSKRLIADVNKKSDSSIDLLACNWDDLEFSLSFAEASLGCTVKQETIITLVTEILIQRGAVPVGEIGKLIQSAFGCDISRRVKDHLGGLKKTLESATESNIKVGTEHPFNPMISLDNTKITSTIPSFNRFHHSHRIVSSILHNIVTKDNASVRSVYTKKSNKPIQANSNSYSPNYSPNYSPKTNANIMRYNKGNSFSEFGMSNDSSNSTIKANRFNSKNGAFNNQSSLMSSSLSATRMDYINNRLSTDELQSLPIQFQQQNGQIPGYIVQNQQQTSPLVYATNQQPGYYQYVYNPSPGTSPTSLSSLQPAMAFQVLNQSNYPVNQSNYQPNQYYYVPVANTQPPINPSSDKKSP